MHWVQASVCGKLTLLVLPEERNTVAKPDLISVCTELFAAQVFNDSLLKFIQSIDTI